jgi:hypothetical protein
VISSFAVIAPYENRGGLQPADRAVEDSFVTKAGRDCAAVLPKYRPVFADGVDGPSIVVAAREVDLLGEELEGVPTATDMQGTVQEWLQAWKNFTHEERLYAAIIGPARHLQGRVAPRSLSPVSQLSASADRRTADQLASQADTFSSNLVGTACRLEEAPTA